MPNERKWRESKCKISRTPLRTTGITGEAKAEMKPRGKAGNLIPLELHEWPPWIPPFFIVIVIGGHRKSETCFLSSQLPYLNSQCLGRESIVCSSFIHPQTGCEESAIRITGCAHLVRSVCAQDMLFGYILGRSSDTPQHEVWCSGLLNALILIRPQIAK